MVFPIDMKAYRRALGLLAFALSALHGHGHTADPENIEEIVVWGRAETLQGVAHSASEGLVGYADFSTRPLQRVGELVEVMPGMVATQHSGEGKANQYFLRGMNLDHGTDFSAYFEGMPVNLRAHAHGQGYLDLNFLIPEVVSTVRYAKGPYHADRGDFSTAGTASFSLYDRLDEAFVDLSGGSDNYWRGVAAGSREVSRGHLLGAVEVLRDDGPWDLATDTRKTNLLAKYTGTWRNFETKGLLLHYQNEWNATDQVPRRLVDAGTIDRFGFIDPNLGGDSARASLIAGLRGEQLSVGFYASRYTLNLFSNFTYFLDDPQRGDQFEQQDERWIYGGHLDYVFDLHPRATLRIGSELCHDDVDAGLYRTAERARLRSVREDAVRWLSVGVFAELEVQASDRLRATLGLRTDHYDFNVRALNPANSGEDAESNLIGSAGLAYALGDHVELYLNWGQGFHSNDVRGSTITVDPESGNPVAPVDVFADQQGAEVGLRMEGVGGLSAALTWFWLESDSELLFVGDAGTVEPSDGSKRRGVEFSGFWNGGSWWSADLVASWVHSRFTGVAAGFDQIPNAQELVIGAGLTYAEPNGWTGSLRVRHFGDAPLLEDGSIHHESTTLVNAGIGYDFGTVEVGFEIINTLDTKGDDIAYYFESRLANEPAPVEDIHFHPVVPFTVRASVRLKR